MLIVILLNLLICFFTFGLEFGSSLTLYLAVSNHVVLRFGGDLDLHSLSVSISALEIEFLF